MSEKAIANYDNSWSHADYEQLVKKFDPVWSYVPDDFGSVLDVGGGPGAMYKSLLKFRSGIDFHLVERSKVAIDMAKSIGIQAVELDFDHQKLPYADNRFDLVILSDVLEHMNNPWAVLAEATRVTKKYVYVHGPNFASLQCRLDALAGNPIRQMVTNKRGSLVDPAGRKANHIYYITYNNLIYWASRAGLSLLKSRVFWFRRYAPFRFFLEPFFKNFGEQYDIVFLKKSTPNKDSTDENFLFFE